MHTALSTLFFLAQVFHRQVPFVSWVNHIYHLTEHVLELHHFLTLRITKVKPYKLSASPKIKEMPLPTRKYLPGSKFDGAACGKSISSRQLKVFRLHQDHSTQTYIKIVS